MFNNRFQKYFRYAQMTPFIFHTIIEFSAAIGPPWGRRGLSREYVFRIPSVS